MMRKREILTIGICASTIALGVFTSQYFYKKHYTVLRIVKPPDPTIRLTSDPISTIDHSIVSLSNDMVSTLRYMAMVDFLAKALLPRGLSAVQVGEAKRLIVCGVNGEIKTLVNPEIIARQGTYISHEGCISLQNGRTRIVKRSAQVTVKYKTLDNRARTLVAKQQNAALLEHEIDHLNGILITDH